MGIYHNHCRCVFSDFVRLGDCMSINAIFQSMFNTNMNLVSEETDLNFVALSGGEESEIKGRVTIPSVRLTDPEFVYRRSCETSLAETLNRARAARGE